MGPLARIAADLAGEAARTVESVRADALFRAAFRSSPFGLIATDSEGRVIELSPMAESLLGVSRRDAQAVPATDLVRIEAGQTSASHPVRRVLDGGEDHTADTRLSLVRPDGSKLAVGCTVNRMRDRCGDPIGVLVTLRDITAERDDELKFRRLLAAAPDAMLLSDATGRILLANDRASHLFGYTAEELMALSIEDLVPEHLRGAHVRTRAAYVLAPKVREMGGRSQLVGRKRDGTAIPLAISLSPFETAGGTLVISAIRDVTEQREAERALTEARDRAEAARTELEAFSYSVAHDLRAPLRSIDGFSQALLEDLGGSLPPEGLGYLKRVRTSAQHMGHLIDDLLALSRVVRVELRSERIDLGKMCADICAKLREAQPHRAVETTIATDLAAMGDPFLLTIALENLLSNSWKFTARQPRARIEVGARRGDEQVYFVQDNGAGFDMQHAARLFQPFQRLHKESDFEGTGIGLATVKRIVGRHGGRIWAEAQPGRGATFFFTLKGRA